MDITKVKGIISMVGGRLIAEDCLFLTDLAKDIKSDGVIMDINCGSGLSTLFLGFGAKECGGRVIAIDPQIRGQEITYTKFYKALTRYGVTPFVTPIVAAQDAVLRLFAKRSADLVVAQCINDDLRREELEEVVDVATHSIRRKGTVVIFCPNDTCRELFDKVLDTKMQEGFNEIKTNSPVARAFESLS